MEISKVAEVNMTISTANTKTIILVLNSTNLKTKTELLPNLNYKLNKMTNYNDKTSIK